MALSASKKIQIFVAAGLFFIGVSIYLLWRDEHLLIHRIIHGCGLESQMTAIRNEVSAISTPEWVRFALPDGLWSTSYILLIDALVKRGYIWTSIIPVIGIISEVMQLAGWLPGTFDICDLFAYAIPYFLYALIINPQK